MLLESFGVCGEWRMCLRRTISLLFKNVEDVRRLKGRWVIFALPCPDLTLFGFFGCRKAFFACLNGLFWVFFKCWEDKCGYTRFPVYKMHKDKQLGACGF